MKKQFRPYFIILLALVAILETSFIGCGGGGSNSNSFDNKSKESTTYSSPSVYSSARGTFYLPSIYSNFIAQALEENTIKENSSITLTEREPKSNESKLFGNDCSRIYRLIAAYKETGLNKSKSIDKVDKPIKISIQTKFPNENQEFYLGVRTSSEADWQYSKLENTFENNYILQSNRFSTAQNTNFTFDIETYNLDEEFAVFRSPLNNINSMPKLQRSPSNMTISNMNFSVQLPYLDLKLGDDGNIYYNSDLVINSCLTSNQSYFTDCSLQTILTFLTDSDSIIERLKAVGVSTQFTDQTVSDTRNGAGNKYIHTISFTDYPTPEITNKVATYSFTLKLRNIPYSEFPDSFRIKSIFTDGSSNIFSTESNITQEKVLSYFKTTSPEKDAIDVATNSSLIIKYIAHNIASMSVYYTSDSTDKTQMNGSFSVIDNDHLLIFTPDSSWPEGETITANVYAQCCNTHGFNGIKHTEFTFTTIASEAVIIPASFTETNVSMITPSPTTNVATNTKIVLRFSRNIKWKDMYFSHLKMFHGVNPVALTLPVYDESARTLTFQPQFPLVYNATYTVKFNELPEPYTKNIIYDTEFEFSTGDGVHSTARISEDLNLLLNGSHTTLPVFNIDFGKNVSDGEAINEYRLKQAFNAIKVYLNGEEIPSDQPVKTWIASYSQMQLSFAYPLEQDTTYEIRMRTGLLDYEDLEITPFESYFFTTLPLITTTMITPAVTNDVATDSPIVIQFSENINWVDSMSEYFILINGKNELPLESYTYDASNKTLTILPQDGLKYHKDYSFKIAPNLKDPTTLQSIQTNTFNFTTMSMARIEGWAESETIYTPIDFSIRVIFPEIMVNNLYSARNAVKLKKGNTVIAPTTATWGIVKDDIGHIPFFLNVLSLTYVLEPETTYTFTMDPVGAMDGRTIAPFPDSTVITYNNVIASVTTPAQTVDVATDTNIIFTFSEDIAWSNSASDKRLFSLSCGSIDITASLTSYVYATDSLTLTLEHDCLLYNATYTLKLDEGLINQNTKQRVLPTSFTFATADADHIQTTVKLATDTNIDGLAILTPTICIDFQQPVMSISLAERALELYQGNNLMTGYRRRWSRDMSKLELYYTATLLPNTEYTLKMKSSIKDALGRIIEPFEDFSFTTLPNIIPTMITPSTVNAPVSTDIVLEFSDPITWKATDTKRIRFQKAMQDIEIGSYVYSDIEKTLTLSPSMPLEHNATYTVTILDALVNDNTRQQVATLSFTFSTDDDTHKQATITIKPESLVDSRAILRPTLTIDFQKMVMSSELSKAKDSIRVFHEDQELTIAYKVWKDTYSKIELSFIQPLEQNTTYKVVMGKDIRDYEGIFIDSFNDFEFTTVDKIYVTMLSPSPNTNVATSTPIILQFSEHIDWVDTYRNKIILRSEGKQLLISNYAYDDTDHTLTITPTNKILYNSIYQILVDEGIKNDRTLQFTTLTTFEYSTYEGIPTTATLTLTDSDNVDDYIIVTPTFIVDFGKEVLNEKDAENSVSLYTSSGRKFESLVKTWTKRRKQLTLTCPTKLNGDTTYTLNMVSTKDKEGIEILPFTPYTFTTLYKGTGTEQSPFYVYTAKQLDEIRKKPTNYFYRLARDIDIATSSYISEFNTVDEGWLPIGSITNKFSGGGFDGNGHKITGLTINRNATDSMGLFGQVASVTIKNVHIAKGSVTGQDACGGVVGYSYNSVIKNCYNESVNVNGQTYVGGICGTPSSTNISNCRNSANVTCEKSMVGGISGWTNTNTTRIKSCINDGKVTSKNLYAGGITGLNRGMIENCISEGTVIAYNYSGGIVGTNDSSAKVYRCFSIGSSKVTINSTDSYCGILAGFKASTSNVFNCIITNNATINGYACSDVKQSIGNYYNPDNEYKIYLYTSISQINIAMSTSANWLSDTYPRTEIDPRPEINLLWDHTIWQLSNLDYPTLKDTP